MNESTFNPKQQEANLSDKIVVGLERIAEVFKVLLWEKAKSVGLSPIQIQILIFTAYHKQDLCNVSHFAKEFNVTKPTISDAIKVLDKKGMIIKDHSSADSRSYSITLSDVGHDIIAQTFNFSNPLKKQVDGFSQPELESLFETLSQLIFKLNKNGILRVQRTCFGCKYFEKNNGINYCNLLQKPLETNEIRLDCLEFEEKPSI